MACVPFAVSALANALGRGGLPPPPIFSAPPRAPVLVHTSPFAEIVALGQSLKNDGAYFQLSYVYNLNSLVSGGLKTGAVPNSELALGTTLDRHTIPGIPQASSTSRSTNVAAMASTSTSGRKV